MSMFKKAERSKIYMKIAITGPTGSGKTFSALRLAKGIGGKIAVIDSENGSAALYSDIGDFDHMELRPPFTAQKYIEAIRAAESEGYNVVIVDSLTHAWAGDGGLLDQKQAKDQRGGNSFTNWAEITRFHEQLKSAMLQSKIHVIVTMRSKMEYSQEKDGNGKTTIRKVGLAPIQREEMPYEFTVVFDIDSTHSAETSKDRTGIFTDEVGQITEKHGKRILEWLASGKDPIPEPAGEAPQEPVAEAPSIDPDLMKQVKQIAKNLEIKCSELFSRIIPDVDPAAISNKHLRYVIKNWDAFGDEDDEATEDQDENDAEIAAGLVADAIVEAIAPEKAAAKKSSKVAVAA